MQETNPSVVHNVTAPANSLETSNNTCPGKPYPAKLDAFSETLSLQNCLWPPEIVPRNSSNLHNHDLSRVRNYRVPKLPRGNICLPCPFFLVRLRLNRSSWSCLILICYQIRNINITWNYNGRANQRCIFLEILLKWLPRGDFLVWNHDWNTKLYQNNHNKLC